MSDNLAAQISSIPIRKLFIKMELLDSKDNVVDYLEGVVIDGSINIDASSDIRRTCDISVMLNDALIPINSNSRIWIDKKFKLYIGIENPVTEETVWYNQGIFYFDQPSISLDESNSTISFTGLDKVCWMDGNYGGTLGYTTKINAGTPMFESIKGLLSIVGEYKFIINDVEELTIPFDLEKDSSSTVLDFLCEIRDLYMGFEFFYDVDGYFVFQRIKDRKYDILEWEFLEDNKLIINYNNTPNWNNIKNKIIVWGN